MPELPEVESRLVYLRATALGQIIDKVIVSEPRIIKAPSPAQFVRTLKHRLLVGAIRRGKYLVITLDDGRALVMHFTMGGSLHYYDSAQEAPRFTRIEFFLESGNRLAFTCPRNICRVMLVDSIDEIKGLREMGPEPLDANFTLPAFKQRVLGGKSAKIKVVLMDQRSIAGVGNIYADEILFQAELRPDRSASSLSDEEIRRLYRSVRNVLKKSLKTADDEEFPPTFLIGLDSRGAGCYRCDSKIERTRIGGRTTRFCPHCQN
ncbi:MAG TPA: DNA-formamidopyrimidine glycosylase family protein [Blastocatellia bacterium]|nr:DNA-formamidopyrimidine glycosylase family protein [Blastocatellia bacterium]